MFSRKLSGSRPLRLLDNMTICRQFIRDIVPGKRHRVSTFERGPLHLRIEQAGGEETSITT